MRQGLAGGGDIDNLDLGDDEAYESTGRCHAVIVIRLKYPAVKWAWIDDQAVRRLRHISAKPIEFSGQCCEAIGFMSAQMCDTAQVRRSAG
jgi:hypothetical protein